MLSKLKSHTQRQLQRAGLDVRTMSSLSRFMPRLARGLQSHNINLVFDVGANVGQFAQALLRTEYCGEIVSFEPLPQEHERLTRSAGLHKRWRVHERCAIGAKEEQTQIHVAGNSVSSSLLEMKSAHVRGAPASAYVGREEVCVHRLDSVASAYLDSSTRAFLKIDAQGFEGSILEGAALTLPKLRGVQVEASLVELYAGETLVLELWQRLQKEGFALWTLEPGFLQASNGRSLQCDMVFFRDDE
jgi:FkbM family methyltransferase